MKISHLRIHNYRSVKDCEVQCDNMVIFLGQNNHGKSNIMDAIQFALTSTPNVQVEDLFAFHDEGDCVTWVELTMSDLTDQEKTTFKKYVRSDGSITYRKTVSFGDNGKTTMSFNGYIQEPQEEYLKSSNATEYANRERIKDTPLKDYVPESGRLTKALIEEAQQRYITEHAKELTLYEVLEDTPLLGQARVAVGVLPEFLLIPAVRDLSEESKVKNTALFGKLLNHAIREMTEMDPRFRDIREQLKSLAGILNEGTTEGPRPQQLMELERSLEHELRDWGVTISIQVNAPEIDKIFELGTDILIDDGLRTLAQQKGHGLQRAVIFGLMKTWARVLRGETQHGDRELAPRKASESIIFAVEEPELFLHPHAQRSLAKALRELSDSHNHQVFICSHSTHFVDLDYYKDIALVRKDTANVGTCIVQCLEELFEGAELDDRKHRFHMASWVNPDRGEMLFAKKVVFVGGETEKTVFPFLSQTLGCFSEDVSIVDCGSKHNLPLYIAIANAFKLKYAVVHDEDPLPDPIPTEWNADKQREKRRTFELNQEIFEKVDPILGNIHVLCPDFEGCSQISHNQAKNKGKALAAIEYYKTKSIEEIPDAIRSVVANVYRGV